MVYDLIGEDDLGTRNGATNSIENVRKHMGCRKLVLQGVTGLFEYPWTELHDC